MTEKEKDAYIEQLRVEVSKWHHAYDALMVERNQLAGLVAKYERIKELEASQPKWVSVKERLPKEGDEDDFGEVLVITDDGICYACEYDPKAGERHKWFNGDIYLHNVTHWMPLPELPKSEK